MKLTRILLAAALPVLAASIAGCDSDPGPDRYIGLNFVTYEGTGASDGLATFTYRAVNDSPEITLVAQCSLPDEVKPGRRMVMQYSTNTPIDTLAVNRVNYLASVLPYGDTLRFMPDSTAWRSDAVHVNALWRSGHYINLDCLVRRASDGVRGTMELVADSVSALTSHPVLFLTSTGQRPGEPYLYTLYGSWNIDTLWSRPDVTAVTVRMDNANLTSLKSVTFNKTK